MFYESTNLLISADLLAMFFLIFLVLCTAGCAALDLAFVQVTDAQADVFDPSLLPQFVAVVQPARSEPLRSEFVESSDTPSLRLLAGLEESARRHPGAQWVVAWTGNKTSFDLHNLNNLLNAFEFRAPVVVTDATAPSGADSMSCAEPEECGARMLCARPRGASPPWNGCRRPEGESCTPAALENPVCRSQEGAPLPPFPAPTPCMAAGVALSRGFLDLALAGDWRESCFSNQTSDPWPCLAQKVALSSPGVSAPHACHFGGTGLAELQRVAAEAAEAGLCDQRCWAITENLASVIDASPTASVQVARSLADMHLSLRAAAKLHAELDRQDFATFLADRNISGDFVVTFTTGGKGARWELFCNLFSSLRRAGAPFVGVVTEKDTVRQCELLGAACFYPAHTLDSFGLSTPEEDAVYGSTYWRLAVNIGKPLALYVAAMTERHVVFLETDVVALSDPIPWFRGRTTIASETCAADNRGGPTDYSGQNAGVISLKNDPRSRDAMRDFLYAMIDSPDQDDQGAQGVPLRPSVGLRRQTPALYNRSLAC